MMLNRDVDIYTMVKPEFTGQHYENAKNVIIPEYKRSGGTIFTFSLQGGRFFPLTPVIYTTACSCPCSVSS